MNSEGIVHGPFCFSGNRLSLLNKRSRGSLSALAERSRRTILALLLSTVFCPLSSATDYFLNHFHPIPKQHGVVTSLEFVVEIGRGRGAVRRPFRAILG